MCSQVAESSLMKLWTEMMTITFQAWLIKTLWSFHSLSSSVCGLRIDVLRDFGSHMLKMEVHCFTWLPKCSNRVEFCPLKNSGSQKCQTGSSQQHFLVAFYNIKKPFVGKNIKRIATILVSVFMSLTALEMIGWQFQDQVFKRLYLPSVYSLFVSLILLELATASCHVVGSPVERPV